MVAEWTWQAPAIAPPITQTGRCGVNHDSPRLATMLFMHRLDSGNTDRTGDLIRLTRHDRIYLQQKSAASSWHRYEVTGRSTLQGECWVIPVTTDVGSPMGTEPGNNAPVLVEIRG